MAKPEDARFVSRDLQIMWLSVLEHRWASLAVVPTEPSVSARKLTDALFQVLQFYPVGPCRIIDASGRSVNDAGAVTEELAAAQAAGARAVVAIDSFTQGLGGFRPAQAAEAVLLVLRLGSDFTSASRTISMVGPEKVLGCVVLGGKA